MIAASVKSSGSEFVRTPIPHIGGCRLEAALPIHYCLASINPCQSLIGPLRAGGSG